MSDTFPPDVTDAELLAYIEGESDGELVERIKQSDMLSKRVHQLRQEIKWLTAHSFRRTCPDTDELGDFHLGVLSAARARAIEQHLARCPFCAREMVQYGRFLGEPPEQPGLVRRVIVSLAKLLDNGLSSGQPLKPAYALRGEEGLVLYQTDRLQISLDVQDDVEKAGYKSIVGIITGEDAHALSVDLWKEGQYLDTASVDETGGFTLSGLLPGDYELIIKGIDIIVLIQPFSF
jgi:hypothetical protein